MCHDHSRAVLLLPGVRKKDLQNLDMLFSELLYGMLDALGCQAVGLSQLKLALGPIQFDVATDRSVLASMTVVTRDLEPIVYNGVDKVLELDPVAVSAKLSRRPATVRKAWVRPDELLLGLVATLQV